MTDVRLGPFGPFAWVDLILLVWFAVTAASAIYVAWDAYHQCDLAPGPAVAVPIRTWSVRHGPDGEMAEDRRSARDGPRQPLKRNSPRRLLTAR